MKKTLLVMGDDLLAAEMAALEQDFELIRLWKEKDPEGTLQKRKNDIVAIASVVFRPVSRKLIEALPNLEIISQFAVGTDNIDLQAAKERGVAVTNTPGVLTDCTADIAMTLLLAVARRAVEGDIYVRVGKWLNGPMPLGVSPKGKTAGIVGLGRIGQAIARRCEAFGMKIAYHGPRKKPDQPYPFYEKLIDMARDSDFLILACPGGEETAGIVDMHVLDALGPKGFLINVSRGSVVDEPALVEALYNKKIAGAGLDVFAKEPNVPPELISMDNVVLLPHIGSATAETRTAMGRLVADNLKAHFEGRPLLTPVKR